MKASVLQGLSDRPIEEGQERDALNNEVRVVLKATRDVVNQESRFKATTTSEGSLGAYKRLWESDQAPTTGTWLLEARVVGYDAAGNAVGYVLRALFQITAAAVAQVGATDSLARETTAAPDARFGIDATARTVYVEAIDDGTHLMAWVAVVVLLPLEVT